MSIEGALSIKILLSPDKLVIHDSKLLQVGMEWRDSSMSLSLQMNYLRDTYINPNYTTVNIFVSNVINPSIFSSINNSILAWWSRWSFSIEKS